MEIKNKVREFLGRFVRNYDLQDDDNIFEKKLVNSLFAMQLITYIEKEFNIVISNDEFDQSNFKSVNAIVTLIEDKCSQVE